MTAEGAPAGLGFGTAMISAHESVFGQFRRFAKLAAVPFALILLIAGLKFPVGHYAPNAEIVLLVADLLPFAILGLAQSRTVLTGEAAGFLPPQPLGRRTWIYLGYALLMIVMAAVPLVVLLLGAINVVYVLSDGGEDFASGPWLAALGFIGFLVLLWVLARLSLVYPALAVDRKLGLVGAWRLSRGSGLKLLGIQVVIFLVTLLAGVIGAAVLGGGFKISLGASSVLAPGMTVADALIDRGPAIVWSALVSIAGYGLIMGAYASAFAQLSGWGAPRREILERFE